MFRDRPLTWLFVVATICVDLVLTSSLDGIVPGIDTGQLSAVAIWAVMSETHRLARSGVFLAVVSLIAGRYSTQASWFFGENVFMTFFVVYAVCVVLALLPVLFLRSWVRSHVENEKMESSWQFPLIELFGWTIIVAYASFACRFLNSESAWQVLTNRYVFLLVPIAVFAAILLENTTLAMYWLRVTLFLVVSLVWILCIALIPFVASKHADSEELVMLCSLGSAYLIVWYTVRMLDKSSLDMRNRIAREPKLFDPQD